MNSKTTVFVAGVCVGVILAGALSCLQLKSPDVIVREPETPGEAAIEYAPPPAPRLSAEMVAKTAPMLAALLREEVRKVTDNVYVAQGYALGNVSMVITDEGLVIIDSTESIESARQIMEDFRKVTDEPVRYVIYTHYHPDHTLGAEVFMEEGTEVIATADFLEWIHYQNEMLGRHHGRSRSNQSGMAAPEFGFEMPVENPFRITGREINVVMPDITFDEEYSFTLGGVRFELFHTRGETPDHLAVYMPESDVLFAGDLYYRSFPNLSTPMLESRPVRGWIESLDRFIEMKPDYLVLGHTDPLVGEELIAEHLANYRDAIVHVHDETVRCINEGKTVHEAVAEIKLPERLAKLPYLQEVYGRVSWSVRGIYHGYKGWYDGRGTGLFPLPPAHLASEVVNISGGADRFLARAIELQQRGEHQLTAELCDLVLAANPDDKLAHRVKAASMEYMAYGRENLNCFGFYRSAYSIHMKAAGANPRSEAPEVPGNPLGE